jgi:uncharacterized membrane protein YhaH (DUF805 family)
MFITEFAIALVVAFILSIGFRLAISKRSRRQGFWWLFLLIFVATWAGGIWLRPFGPSIGGVRWIQFLVSGLIFVGMIALFVPGRPPNGRRETLEKLAQIRQGKVMEEATYFTLGIIFWLLLIILVIAIAVRYLPDFNV